MARPKARTSAVSWGSEADSVFNGTGAARIPEQIKRDIAGALHRAYLEGRAAMYGETRERVLREHRSIMEGMRQALDARARTLEQELNAAKSDDSE